MLLLSTFKSLSVLYIISPDLENLSLVVELVTMFYVYINSKIDRGITKDKHKIGTIILLGYYIIGEYTSVIS